MHLSNVNRRLFCEYHHISNAEKHVRLSSETPWRSWTGTNWLSSGFDDTRGHGKKRAGRDSWMMRHAAVDDKTREQLFSGVSTGLSRSHLDVGHFPISLDGETSNGPHSTHRSWRHNWWSTVNIAATFLLLQPSRSYSQSSSASQVGRAIAEISASSHDTGIFLKLLYPHECHATRENGPVAKADLTLHFLD